MSHVPLLGYRKFRADCNDIHKGLSVSHITESKKKLATRISRIKGQIESLDKALHGGVECAQFLHQIASVRGAIDGLMSEALEGHIREHLGHHHHDHASYYSDVQQASHQRDLDEVINVLKTYLK